MVYWLFDRGNWQVPAAYAPYLSVAALAGLDTVLGGIKAGIEGRFQNDIFASGFLLNTSLAALMAWLGDAIGLNLALVAVLVLGGRIFLNLSLIRRYYLTRRAMARSQQQEEAAAAAATAAATSLSAQTEPH
ncbi:MAG: small basic family protein [Armatimonadetes bacterium]|nr:small basic family protein [Armatimonadota bacterium]MDE2205223.1 small basic family protein [Armatimonadota bacterium]